MRGRQSFVDLRRHGLRTSSGPIWITYHADATDHPRLAFAIGRAVGTAVARNRARRQLRAMFADIAHDQPELVPPGNYLVGVRRTGFSSAEARTWLAASLQKLRAP